MKYSDAGVDIKKGDLFASRVGQLAKSTHIEGVVGSIGGFAGIFDMAKSGFKDPLLAVSTDGVGTKSLVANAMNSYFNLGLDLVAMCVNDILSQGAKPVLFLDYLASSKLNFDVNISLVEGIVDGCKQAGCALIGGETAEMPGLYPGGENDLAGFCVGLVERDDLLPKKQLICRGDLVFGLSSSGLHSNGFSLIRSIFDGKSIDYRDVSPFEGRTWGEILLVPTRIYVKQLLGVINRVKAIAHITGGGIVGNVSRVLPEGLRLNLVYDCWPDLFKWVMEQGEIKKQEILSTFNCGVGVVMVIAKDEVDYLRQSITEDLIFIGEVI